jgi:hypothetical protein
LARPILSQDQSNPTWSMLEEEWAVYEDKTNFGHSSRRKKNEHDRPEDDYCVGGHCTELPLWDKFVLLDGDEDFVDERPSWNKRMRKDLSSYEDDDESESSSVVEKDDGEQLSRLPRVSLNGTDMVPV